MIAQKGGLLIITSTLNFLAARKTPNVKWHSIIKADIEGVWFDFCREVLDFNINFKAFLVEFEVKLIDNETSIKLYVVLLKDFKDKGYKLYLNRPRNKILSEAVILR